MSRSLPCPGYCLASGLASVAWLADLCLDCYLADGHLPHSEIRNADPALIDDLRARNLYEKAFGHPRNWPETRTVRVYLSPRNPAEAV